MAGKGKGRRASGEGTLEYIPSEDCYRVRLTVRTPEGSKRKTFKAKKQRDVIKKRDDWLRQNGRGRRAIASERATLADYLDDWLQTSARQSVGPSTFVRYEQVVRVNLKPLLGGIRLREVSAPDVRFLKQALLDSGRAPATASYVQGVLSGALNQAVADGLILSNPCKLVKKAKDRKGAMRVLTEAEAGRLVAHVEGTRDEALYVLALKLGPRQGELSGLLWSDLSLGSPVPTLSIERSVDTRHAGARWGAPKTGEARTVRLPRSVADALRRHGAMQKRERMAAKAWEDRRLVFPNGRGGVHRRSSVLRRFYRHLEDAGLPRIRFHDLRHTAATLMLRGGIPVNVAAQILGHKDASMTLKRYAHVLSDMQDAAAERIDDYGF